MSRSRTGRSRTRAIKRAGLSKLDAATGQIKRRPHNNKPQRKKGMRKNRKPSYIFHQPMMVVEVVDTRTGNMKEILVPKTVTKSYKRRVFPDAEGNLPINAQKGLMHVGGRPFIKDGVKMVPNPYAKYKEIYYVIDTKEVPVSPVRCPIVDNPEGYKTDDEKAYWDMKRNGASMEEIQAHFAGGNDTPSEEEE